jgi:hypothetical protein
MAKSYTLDEVNKQMMERIARLEAKRAAVLDPSKKVRTPGTKGALTEFERIQRAKEKARVELVQQTIKERNAALKSILDVNIERTAQAAENSVASMQEIFQTYPARRAYLQAQQYMLDKKMEAAEQDIDNMIDALNNYEEFNQAVNDCVREALEAECKFDPAQIKVLWEKIMSPKDVAMITRATTVEYSLDYIWGLVCDKFATDPDAAFIELEEKVATLFEKYGLKNSDKGEYV